MVAAYGRKFPSRKNGCPSPGALFEWAENPGNGSQFSSSEALSAHIDGCAVCQRELKLIRDGFVLTEGDHGDSKDYDYVLKRTDRKIRELVDHFSGRRSRWSRLRYLPALVFGVSAAALVILFSNPLSFQPSVRPVQLDGETTVRGSEVVLMSPLGTVAGVPETFRWGSVPRAKNYKVTVFDGAGVPIHEGVIENPNYELPDGVVLDTMTRYTWRVEAYDEEGETIRGSRSTQFVIDPSSNPD